MPLHIIQGDITRMQTDAIVNAANKNLLQGGGVCGAIFRAAGTEDLKAECDSKAPCPLGEAVITNGYALAAKYVIHAVGPVWSGGNKCEEKKLAGAYSNSLRIARENSVKSIAFPLISSGIYGYPVEEAAQVAIKTILNFLQEDEDKTEVYLVLFSIETTNLCRHIYANREQLYKF